ncbi:MAG: hypothetical protein ACLTTZ_00490 [Lachnospiraceae bacterium]
MVNLVLYNFLLFLMYASKIINSYRILLGKIKKYMNNIKLTPFLKWPGGKQWLVKHYLNILDPDSYVTCNAYNKNNSEINENVHLVNSRVISMATMEISLQIDDFSFMIAKLCEVVREFLPLGDVILVPDGPKPLIFAMSLVPLLIDKAGITCLHVSRNKDFYNAVNVKPTDFIYGFSV